MPVTKQQALDYHFGTRPGKIEVTPTKPCRTQHDLSLAYTPGVAVPCMEIHKNPHDAFKYTGRGNLVAVVTNGTAVLGLGDIGAISRSTATIPTMSSRYANCWSRPSVVSTWKTSRPRNVSILRRP